MVNDPTLPSLPAVAEWIQETRYALDITLAELGEDVHLSSSQLSRLENEEGNPSYKAVYRVYQELKQREGEITVENALIQKRERYDTLQVEYVRPQDSCAEAAKIMNENNISQLPVIENGRSIGGITDTALMDIDSPPADVQASECTLPHLPEVPVTENKTTVQSLLHQNPAVLLTESETADFQSLVGPYVGLLTAADFR
jgi:Predicted transcriptional regulator with C-terminal CBS domains